MCIIYTLLIVNVYGELIGSHFLQQKECHFKCIYFPMMNDVNFDDILVFSVGGAGWDWQGGGQVDIVIHNEYGVSISSPYQGPRHFPPSGLPWPASLEKTAVCRVRGGEGSLVQLILPS